MLNRNPKPRPHRWMQPITYRPMKRKEKLAVQYHNDWMSVKALRKFVNGFSVQDGYTLNAVHKGTLSSAQKAKIRRYSLKYRPEVVAVNSGKYVLKHYRNKERMRSAVEASQQEAPLAKDQRNAVFYTKDRTGFKIKVLRNRKGIEQFVFSDLLFQKQVKVRFNDPVFLAALSEKVGGEIEEWTDVLADQPELVAETVSEMLPGFEFYKFLTGKYSSTPVLAGEWEEYVRNEAMKYESDDGGIDPESISFIYGAEGLNRRQSTKQQSKKRQRKKR